VEQVRRPQIRNELRCRVRVEQIDFAPADRMHLEAALGERCERLPADEARRAGDEHAFQRAKSA
jgi:hypothetical protein